ncbi:MAG: class I SAM-dependent methyltransferase [Kamptonema sp. SIO1D9]|nr:class I SAM-dependent methyltransferase [Kamptonema sp. SIO1D9]
MENQPTKLIDKIRQQFDFGPYPRVPIEKSPKDNGNLLFIHNLITPYYLRNHQVTNTEGKIILDAGCGTGWKSLALAEANPGAKIVGIDLSEKSIELARERLQFHGHSSAEFHVLSLEDLPTLGIEFDYINCDELLYLFDDIAAALRAMKAVLKPEGIIRSNLHSSLQRFNYFRAQEVFQIMGLLEENPEEEQIEMALETIKALKNGVDLKVKTWNPNYEDKENGKETVLMNYLFQGDKGYTIPQLFNALTAADLTFISMVNWRHWEIMDLFKNPDELPIYLAFGLGDMSEEGKLHLFELLHPIHRLLDFWCGHPDAAAKTKPVEEYTDSDWEKALVYLHPQLKTEKCKQEMLDCITEMKPFQISSYITSPALVPIHIESNIAACLLPLWEQPQSVTSLVERWLKLKPVHPVTLEPMTQKTAWAEVKEMLTRLEAFLYLLLDCSA